MFDPINPSAYLLLRPVLTTLMLTWGILWALVAYHYGRASYVSWATQGRGLRWAVADIVDPFWWAIKSAWCRLPFIRNKSYCEMSEVPSPYTSGHLLRFAIFLGSLSPAMFGLTLSDVDRRNYSPVDLSIVIFFVSTSILAAGGHLFLAYRKTPKAWERLVILGMMWLAFGPFIVNFFYLR